MDEACILTHLVGHRLEVVTVVRKGLATGSENMAPSLSEATKLSLRLARCPLMTLRQQTSSHPYLPCQRTQRNGQMCVGAGAHIRGPALTFQRKGTGFTEKK